jgi:hypothetical protein
MRYYDAQIHEHHAVKKLPVLIIRMFLEKIIKSVNVSTQSKEWRSAKYT